jgi:hypothetical protein
MPGQFVYHWQYVPSVAEREVFDAAVALAHSPGENLPEAAAQFIARHTGADFTLVGHIRDDRQVATAAFLAGSRALPATRYPLAGTPCELVLNQHFCYYPNHVREIFPGDRELQELGLESYLGSLLLSPEGEPLGLVAIMGRQPFSRPGFAEHLILLLSPVLEEALLQNYLNPIPD